MRPAPYDDIESWYDEGVEMKKWYKSWTLIVNACAIVILVTEYLVTKQIVNPEIHALVVAIANIILRLKTNKAVTK